jgi:hypothetical protein
MDKVSCASIAFSYFINFFITAPYTSVYFLLFSVCLASLPRSLLAFCPVLFPVLFVRMSCFDHFLLCLSSFLFCPVCSMKFPLYSTLLFTVLVLPFSWLSILSQSALSFFPVFSLIFFSFAFLLLPLPSHVLSFVLSSLFIFLLTVFLSSHFCLHYYLVPSLASRAGIFKHSMGAKNQVGIGLSYWPAMIRGGGIDALESSLGLLKV